MSYLARMLYMHSMISYSVRRGSVQRPSLEDSTEEPKTNSAVASGRWEGPMTLLVKIQDRELQRNFGEISAKLRLSCEISILCFSICQVRVAMLL